MCLPYEVFERKSQKFEIFRGSLMWLGSNVIICERVNLDSVIF